MNKAVNRILLATNNKGKVREFRSLLKGLPFELVTPEELGITTEVDETGKTLEENARLKAVTLAGESKLVSLADDSGLEVDALNGEPGPLSARYAGAGATDKDRVNYLLKRLHGVPPDKRTARFRCVIAAAKPDGEVEMCSGECHGIITGEPKGETGFGYDPIFYLPEYGKTMAELPLEIKNNISHRGNAARKVTGILAKLGII
ncbi:MAG: XTP/dITP diphosphatase [Dehalococcoidales bacterium]|nr:XTP/dITP diphosphatase [Dehalococcoidales bacterium]